MNDRERRWYEGKYGRHPPVCACVACDLARRIKHEAHIEAEMKRMRKEERRRFIKLVVKVTIPVVVIVIVGLGLLGIEPWANVIDVIRNFVVGVWQWIVQKL